MQTDLLDSIKKYAPICAAIALWAVSIYFSYTGFNFIVGRGIVIGLVLALAVTVVELIFTTDISHLNMTLFIFGILAYGYGVYSNVAGIISYMGGISPSAGLNAYIFPSLVGLFIEVVPVPLFLFGTGSISEGDFVGNIVKGSKLMDKWTSQPTNTVFTKKKNFDPNLFKQLPRKRQ